ncbi:MAG: DUF559 domain-containing protein [Pseudomonadota bacterium]
MTPQRWYAQNHHLLGSQFEHLFFENVLSDLPDLDFACVQAQMPFLDDEGKQRFCDFSIKEGFQACIAIEIDGYDKRGTGEGMTHAEFIDWQRRQAALTSQGWHVLRFANRDVCNEPVRCRNNIHSLRVKLRQKEDARFDSQKSITRQASEPVKAINKSKAHSIKPKRRKKPVKQELRKMGVAAGFFAAVILSFLFYGQPWLSNQLQAALPIAAPVGEVCPNAIHWSDMRKHIGETITTRGPIKLVTYKPEVNGSPTWIEVGAKFPDSNRLTLLIWGDDRPVFESQITDQNEGDTVCVKGEVREYQGGVQIHLQEAEQLTVF